ncbi:MAG: hypothetical protein IKU86_12395, partial [Thermoguttaceae bacterium]|nr:hypothetical protein [Thermoguttaceae bacterium]
MGERMTRAAKLGLWCGVAASAACVASWSVGRTLDEAVGATGPSAAVERLDEFDSSAEAAFADGATASEAERLLRDSIARLEGLRSFSADLNFEARFFGELYFGRGRYEETTEPTTGGAAR